MRHIHSHNYEAFTCTAGACPASCCKGGWQIMIDDEHLKQYTQDTGDCALNKRLAEGVDLVEQWFNQEDGDCRLLDKDGLCAIQRALGEEALCDTCRRYPRHVEEFRGVREWSLSLSCPEAARIILENKDRLMFSVDEDDEPENDADYEDFNDDFYYLLNEARDRIFDIIQSRNYSFRDKAILISGYVFGIQDCIDNENFELLQPYIESEIGLAEVQDEYGHITKQFVFDMDESYLQELAEAAEADMDEANADYADEADGYDTEAGIEQSDISEQPCDAIGYASGADLADSDTAGEDDELIADGINVIDETTEINYEPLHRNLFSVMFNLETLAGDWDTIIDNTWEKWNPALELNAEQEIQAEQLLMFWVYTYFCGAVYDGWVYSKAMLAISSTWWILQINAANHFEGGIIEAAYRYAREIEHSDENLNALEEWFMRRE